MLTVSVISAFFEAYTQSDWFGKAIFLGLFTLSITTWFMIFYKIYVLREISQSSTHFENIVKNQESCVLDIPKQKIPLNARKIAIPYIDLYLGIQKKAIELLDKNYFFLCEHLEEDHQKPDDVYLSHIDMEFMESYAQTLIESNKERLEKDLFILATTSTLAPFLGLLGTVWGILLTFTGIQKTGGLSSNSAVLSGLSTALTTTVIGLLIAIPALIAYNYFKNYVKSYYSGMQNFGSGILANIELHYRKVDLNL